MRLFVALEIDDLIRRRIGQFIEDVEGFAPEARWVKPESLHVTLKFIGEKSDGEVEAIRRGLESIDAGIFTATFGDCGFFPAARAARVFWIGVKAGWQLTALATAVDEKLAVLNVPREGHAFNPHITLARARGGSGSPRKLPRDGRSSPFRLLREKLASWPVLDFDAMTVSTFFLYQSQLSPAGSKYVKLAEFSLH